MEIVPKEEEEDLSNAFEKLSGGGEFITTSDVEMDTADEDADQVGVIFLYCPPLLPSFH